MWGAARAKAKAKAIGRYRLSPAQAQAILELRLHRLTGLEQEKIHGEYNGLMDEIIALVGDRAQPRPPHGSHQRRTRRSPPSSIGDERRTEIRDGEIDLSMEDLIPEEDVVVTLSHAGYAKSQPATDYTAQRRGGKGRIATRTKEEDFVGRMFVAQLPRHHPVFFRPWQGLLAARVPTPPGRTPGARQAAGQPAAPGRRREGYGDFARQSR